ncbi:uncharacterized protein LOC116768012 isoform X2 [Danaus plexippus]|uniref:uncharacterized protein LOC116768012 isoform X2 n=1 Tax=Danaus plexippus TaxID=13037 RepID=UPI002AAF9EE5|nr:uncharacterized protein LOC116768012 isoform X2 [Danaus plexippus]
MRKLVIITFIVAVYSGVSHGHPFHKRSHSMPSPRSRDSCSFTCDDLVSFVTLAKILDDKEPEKEVPAVQTVFNAEEIIMKLVNALIYATTHRIQNHCQCPHSVTPSLSSDKSGAGGAAYPSNGDNDHLNEGLVNLDLLNSKRKNNVLDLDLSNHHVLGVGLGTKNQNDNSYQTAHRNVKGNEPNSSAVSIGKQNVVGVGLGGIGETNGSGKQVATQMSNDRNEDLVNLQVLNPNKDGNVANLAVGGQNVLGVGLGN